MPLVFNGVTIPENVANALSFNGVDITDVFFNGVQVWNQALFNATWSGNSLDSINNFGIQTSGNLCRISYNTVWGAWISADSSGLLSGTSQTDFFGIKGFTTVKSGDVTTWDQIPDQPSNLVFTPSTGFTGSTGTYTTSGGGMRFSDGAWIFLT